MFILQTRYPSIEEVKIADVLACFPVSDPTCNHHFRFETCIYNQVTHAKIVCFKDVVCNDRQTLQALAQVKAPVYKDKIRLKVLRIPKRVPAKQYPAPNPTLLKTLYHAPANVPVSEGGNPPGGFFGNLGENIKQSAQRAPDVSAVASEVHSKLSSAAKGLSGALGNLGSQIMGSAQQQNYREYSGSNPEQAADQHAHPSAVHHLNFSDDEHDDGWKEVKVPAARASHSMPPPPQQQPRPAGQQMQPPPSYSRADAP